MRKVFAIAAMGLLVLALPALAVDPATTDGTDMTSAGPRTGSSGACVYGGDGPIVWDSGMYDEFTPPVSCSGAFSAGCMVNADTTGTGPWLGDFGRRLGADDWLAPDNGLVTHIKIWARVNQAAANLGYDGDTPAPMLHGFCVEFYEAVDMGGRPYCPDGIVTGEGVIGTSVYSMYCTHFVTWFVTTGRPRNWAYCISLPYWFSPTPDKWYWVSVSPDFDYQYDEVSGAYSQMFWCAYPGLGISECEVTWWDGWKYGSDAAWTPISRAVHLACWYGWDASFVLCNILGDVATEPTTWGRIKANYR